MEELLNQLYNYLLGLGGVWAVTAAIFVAVCSALATVLPAPQDGANVFWRVLYGLINLVGMNVGKATNFDDVLRGLEKEAEAEKAASAPEKLG